MWLKFTKMHGAGNDFVVLDGIAHTYKLKPERIRKICDRNFGIGCDQLLLVEPPQDPAVDFNYRIFNADGNEVEHCGNGARCFAKYVRDRKLCFRNPVRVSTASGNIEITYHKKNRYSVDMGQPKFRPAQVPIQPTDASTEGFSIDSSELHDSPMQYQLATSAGDVNLSAVSMGNPHGVLTVDNTETAPVNTLGKELISHPDFPQGANIGFMQIISEDEIRLRVHERGVGETLACGTGACAAVVCGIRAGLLASSVKVSLPGGELQIDWNGEGHSVILTGPAKTVFHGQIRI